MRKDEIVSWLESLIRFYGKARNPISETELRAYYEEKNYGAMFSFVRRSMKLDIKLKAAYVNSGGTASAPAWIRMPDRMPLYNSEAFRSLTLTVFIRKEFLAEASFAAVVAVISHELAHILLDSTYHPLRRQEEAVDLTAMLHGYSMFFTNSDRVSIHISSVPPSSWWEKAIACLGLQWKEEPSLQILTQSFGYLTMEERIFAKKLMLGS